jgi:hypothetical protein
MDPRVLVAGAVGAVGLAGAVGCSPPVSAGEPIRVRATLGGLGDTPGRLAYPRALCAFGDQLWVIDRSARVQRLDPETGACLAYFQMPEWELGKPVGFTIAPDGGAGGEALLYIADTHYHRVVIVRPPKPTLDGPVKESTPEIVRTFGAYGTEPGQFIYPTDVAVLLSPDGRGVERIYVAEYGGNERVSVFDRDFGFLFSFGGPGSGMDPSSIQFSRPQSIEIAEVSGVREVVIADAINHRVGRFTLDGRLIAWIGSTRAPGPELGKFNYPYGVSPLDDGTVLVSEFGGNRVQRIDLSSGASLGAVGRAGRGDGELAGAWAVTGIGGTAFVADASNNRIFAWRVSGGRFLGAGRAAR